MTPKELLAACPQCGAEAGWIEQYESVNRYNEIAIEFKDDGSIAKFDVVIGQTQEDQVETIEYRCMHCGLELTEEASALVEGLFG